MDAEVNGCADLQLTVWSGISPGALASFLCWSLAVLFWVLFSINIERKRQWLFRNGFPCMHLYIWLCHSQGKKEQFMVPHRERAEGGIYCDKIHKTPLRPFLSIQFSGLKNIHTVGWPSPHPSPELSVFPNETVPIKHQLLNPLPADNL